MVYFLGMKSRPMLKKSPTETGACVYASLSTHVWYVHYTGKNKTRIAIELIPKASDVAKLLTNAV